VAGQEIIIASSSLDERTCAPVAEMLEARGFSVINYQADKVADGSVKLDVRINDQGTNIKYDGQDFHPDQVAAGWYRRPMQFIVRHQDPAVGHAIDQERNVLQHALWDMVPGRAWLNPPREMRVAEQKLTQLVLAQEIGFTIPDTVVTNSWDSIAEALPEDIIFKPSQGKYYRDGELMTTYTRAAKNLPGNLPVHTLAFPGIWQPQLAKTREWRITAVGEHFFDAAIYTADEAKVDWRYRQLRGDLVEFRNEQFPDAAKDMCRQYLGRMGLRFGAFDFIENDNGLTFLECNVNGQFGWLEDRLGMPISAAITDELATIATS
jgi:hypothetical protein